MIWPLSESKLVSFPTSNIRIKCTSSQRVFLFTYSTHSKQYLCILIAKFLRILRLYMISPKNDFFYNTNISQFYCFLQIFKIILSWYVLLTFLYPPKNRLHLKFYNFDHNEILYSISLSILLYITEVGAVHMSRTGNVHDAHYLGAQKISQTFEKLLNLKCNCIFCPGHL